MLLLVKRIAGACGNKTVINLLHVVSIPNNKDKVHQIIEFHQILIFVRHCRFELGDLFLMVRVLFSRD